MGRVSSKPNQGKRTRPMKNRKQAVEASQSAFTPFRVPHKIARRPYLAIARALLLTGFCLASVSVASPTEASAAEGWKAGVSSVAITPTGPHWMAGYASRKEPSAGKVHDLHAKALVLQDADGNRFAIVTLDLIGIPREFGHAVAAEVEQRSGITPAQLLLNASHTHCGPELRAKRGELWAIPAEWSKKVEPYVADLRRKLVELVAVAADNVQPSTLTFSEATADFARNRRFPTANGFVNRQYDDGPTDHAVPVLCVRDTEGTTTAIVFGYACHNTTLSFQQFCGDYAGFAQYDLEERHPGAVALFVQGAGGDQNPYPRRELQLAQQHGRALADAVDHALSAKQIELTGTLRSARANADLEFQPLPPRDVLEERLRASNPYVRRKAEWLLEQLASKQSVPTHYACPVQTAMLGDQLLLVAIGGEVVVDYALRCKAQYPDLKVWFAGYSNDVFGYLPSLRVLQEGGYEGGGAMTYTTLPGPFSETVESCIWETTNRLVKQVSTSAAGQ